MKKFAAVLLGATAFLSAGAAYAADLVVGVSWNNFQEERWKTDEAAIKSVLDAAGVKYISTDAQSSATKQLTDIEQLISQGANALIVLAQDGEAIQPAVQKALDEGIPVVGYDRLIENKNAFYITFDNKGVGKMQAQAIYNVVPKGNYLIIKGNSADANADFLRSGIEEVIGDAVKKGDIKIVGESYTDNWDP
ncbi:MAG: substrate-binding domain-containing protein, partial [Devosia sp.]